MGKEQKGRKAKTGKGKECEGRRAGEGSEFLPKHRVSG